MINENPFQIHTFKNGVRLIHQYTANTEIGHCAIIINAGTRDEPPGKEGLAHFLEHVFFKGTVKRKSIHILNRLEVVGGELNAFTTKEETCLHASFMKQYLQRALELLYDIAFCSVFPIKEIEKEKEVVLDEIRMYLDTPGEQIFDDFESLIFKGHALGNPILGTVKTVKGFTQKDIVEFLRNNYQPENIIISISGDYDFDKLIALCSLYFSHIKPKVKVAQRKPFKHYKPVDKVEKKNTEQAHFVIGTQAYSLKNNHRIKMILLNNILGGPGMNSRLNLSIRERYGYSYNIESNYVAYSDVGMFSIYLATEKKLLEKTIALAKRELISLCENPIKPNQLKQYKNQLMGQIALAQENKASVMIALGRSLMNHGKVDTLQTVFHKIEQVTAEQLQSTAQEIFVEDKMSSLLYIS